MVRDDTIVQPLEATTEDLLVVHNKKYINGLKVSLHTVVLDILIYI